MQLGDPQDVDTWSDQEVTMVLTRLAGIEEALINSTQFQEVITVSVYFMILIAGMNIGYKISIYFLPNATDIGAKL